MHAALDGHTSAQRFHAPSRSRARPEALGPSENVVSWSLEPCRTRPIGRWMTERRERPAENSRSVKEKCDKPHVIATLGADTTLTIDELLSPPTIGGTTHFWMQGFSIDPQQNTLIQPATVTVKYDHSEFGTPDGIPLEGLLGVYFIQILTGTTQSGTAYSIDTGAHTLTATPRPASGAGRACKSDWNGRTVRGLQTALPQRGE
jgi:hypothetical protein